MLLPHTFGAKDENGRLTFKSSWRISYGSLTFSNAAYRLLLVLKLCCLLVVWLLTLSLSAQQIALTFDDLPSTGEAPPGMSSLDIARSILKSLHAAHAPPIYGFLNAGTLTGSPDEVAVLKAWNDAGNLLGNHTFSHRDLNTSTIDDYERDIAADEPVLKKFMGRKAWHWFRYPYLSEGETLEKRTAVRAYLEQHGYRIAQVTIDFGDYAWNDPYARCLATHDQTGVAWLKASYLARAEESLDVGRETAILAYGRDIPHVLLLHVGGIETVMLPRLLALLRRKHFTLVTLQHAESDPAYGIDPGVAIKNGSPLTQEIVEARHLSAPAHLPEIFSQLDALCR